MISVTHDGKGGSKHDGEKPQEEDNARDHSGS